MRSTHNSHTIPKEWTILLLTFTRKLSDLEEETLMYQGLVALSLQKNKSKHCEYIATLPTKKLDFIIETCHTFPEFIAIEHDPVLPNYTYIPSPIIIGNDLCVIDPSLPIPDGSYIHIEAGTAFGTGRHPSTQLLLRWIHTNHCYNLDICDVGCGSGILGIYAKMKGAKRVLSIDIDPEAIERTHHHAQLNNVDVEIKTELNEIETFDLIFSNCERKVLIALCPQIEKALKPGGLWVITGIIGRSWKTLHGHLPAWPIIQEDKQSGWVLKCLKKPEA